MSRRLKWKSLYQLRLSDIDPQHKGVFELTMQLQKAAEGDSGIDIAAVAENIRRKAIDHFAHEEKLMRWSGCDSYVWHKRQHDTVRNRLARDWAQLQQGNHEVAAEFVAFMSQWLDAHIRIADRMMGAHLQNYRWAQAVSKAS
jgi:hemerythrin-like metal-binding protein